MTRVKRMVQTQIPTFRPKAFEAWEFSFRAASNIKRLQLIAVTKQKEEALEPALSSMNWSDLLVAVEDNEEAIGVLMDLPESNQNFATGIDSLKTRFRQTDIERKEKVMLRLETFAFSGKECLFGAFERFKSIKEKTEKLGVGLPKFRGQGSCSQLSQDSTGSYIRRRSAHQTMI
eukprot:GHVR01011673.1.p1 GENE.GHVR01011673.1~~GHVR01011673.1.p1  ORF type:complete len:186 (+),score=13.44 GHVR01011673.1:36-560(+)